MIDWSERGTGRGKGLKQAKRKRLDMEEGRLIYGGHHFWRLEERSIRDFRQTENFKNDFCILRGWYPICLLYYNKLY